MTEKGIYQTTAAVAQTKENPLPSLFLLLFKKALKKFILGRRKHRCVGRLFYIFFCSYCISLKKKKCYFETRKQY